MANSFEIIRYKQQIMSLLVNNDYVVELIDNTDIEEPEDLIGNNLFNYIRIPQSIEEAETYIAFEIDVPKINDSNKEWFKQLVITFYIIAHESTMPTTLGGTRIDLLAAEIDKMFTGYVGIGKQPLQLKSNTSNGISVKHRCRILTFMAEDWIDAHCEDNI